MKKSKLLYQSILIITNYSIDNAENIRSNFKIQIMIKLRMTLKVKKHILQCISICLMEINVKFLEKSQTIP